MSLALYMDHNVRREITEGLRSRGVAVLTAFEDGAATLPDPKLLDRATILGRVLFSRDEDLLQEAARRQKAGETFAGVNYSHQLDLPIGRCIDDLKLIAGVETSDDFVNRVQYLPL